MLIRKPVLEAIAAGRVDRAFRRWERPRVRPGTRLRTMVGVVEVLAIEEVDPDSLTEDDARRAGARDLAALRKENDRRTGPLHRVTLRLVGEDPRIALRSSDALTDPERADLAGRLARMDAAGPWTATVLALIADNEGVRAPDLAARLGRETLPFKRDVRKLKELGLTESLPVGYRLSPRGRTFLGSGSGAATTPPPAGSPPS